MTSLVSLGKNVEEMVLCKITVKINQDHWMSYLLWSTSRGIKFKWCTICLDRYKTISVGHLTVSGLVSFHWRSLPSTVYGFIKISFERQLITSSNSLCTFDFKFIYGYNCIYILGHSCGAFLMEESCTSSIAGTMKMSPYILE